MSCPGKQIGKNQWPLHAISCFFLNVSMKVWYYLVVVYFDNFQFHPQFKFLEILHKSKNKSNFKAPYQKKNLLYSNENFYTMSLNLRKMELARDFWEQ